MNNRSLLFIVFGGMLLMHCGRKQNIHPLTETWQSAVPLQTIPDELTSLSSQQCGLCHVEHYKEWQSSTHAHSWTDLQFQSELKKESSPYLCVNCHTPLQNQQEYVVTGLVNGDVYQPVKKLNPDFDQELKMEGINCATCHVRNGDVIGPTGYSEPGAHFVRQDTTFLSEKLCISCHNASAVVTPELVCAFETGNEWMNNKRPDGKTCIDCHMPEVKRASSWGGKVRKSRFHNFPGSGISKWDSLEVEGLRGLSFTPSNLNDEYNSGDSIRYELIMKNEFAGHRVPTGDPERFFLIKIELIDVGGKVVASLNERIGETWEWYPKAKKLSDNNLNPGEERRYLLSTLVNEPGKYKLITKVTKHRLDQASADYNKLTRQYPLYIDVYATEQSILVQ